MYGCCALIVLVDNPAIKRRKNAHVYHGSLGHRIKISDGKHHIAHCSGIFFSFPKHPSQVRFRSSVQILWKLLVGKDSTTSIQTNNFHKT